MERIYNLIGSGVGFASLLSATACAATPIASARQVPVAAQPADCAAGPSLLNATLAEIGLEKLGLTSLQQAPLNRLELPLSKPRLTILTGSCAAFVRGANSGVVGLASGHFYRVIPNVSPVPEDGIIFRKPDLEASQIPAISDAQFLDADRVESRRSGNKLARRYVGLWKQGDSWLIGEFTVPELGGKAGPVRLLLRSTLPIRSITFFPAPDTPAGNLTLVQEGRESIRVIDFLWKHGVMQ